MRAAIGSPCAISPGGRLDAAPLGSKTAAAPVEKGPVRQFYGLQKSARHHVFKPRSYVVLSIRVTDARQPKLDNPRCGVRHARPSPEVAQNGFGKTCSCGDVSGIFIETN